jgi:acyl-coenzyme A synthetase/AMP-(fatty) acid ligase
MVMNQTETARLCRNDRVLQICHLGGAAAASEIFSTLLNGATLFPFDLKNLGASRLAQFLQEEKITVCTFVPVVFRLLLASLPKDTILKDMRLVRLSGDRVLRQDCVEFSRHFPSNCLLRTSLGASEAMLYTQYNMHHDHIPERAVIPAGYALNGMEVIVVDDDRVPLGPHQTGEIAVKSRYLSAGYWKNDELTAERFVDSGDDASRIYFTRDIGFLEPDGCLIHLGRKDTRVKIHGKLVTLGAIEEFLLNLTGVEQAAVVAIPDSLGERYLVAFYVGSENRGPIPAQVKAVLKTHFPAEVVPRKVLRLGSFPITDRNKVDRRRLMAELADFERLSLA